MRRGVAAAVLALATGLPAAAEQLLFGLIPIPDETDVRLQVIERQPTEAWPFKIDRGYLLCVPIWGMRQVYFASEEEPVRITGISIDPFASFSQMHGADELVHGAETPEEFVKALWPFVKMGERLCDQDGGAMIGPGDI